MIFSQGQAADAVFYIQQGKVKLTVVSEQGKEAVIAVGHLTGGTIRHGFTQRRQTSEYPSLGKQVTKVLI